jgi:hypothetical protein
VSRALAGKEGREVAARRCAGGKLDDERAGRARGSGDVDVLVGVQIVDGLSQHAELTVHSRLYRGELTGAGIQLFQGVPHEDEGQ